MTDEQIDVMEPRSKHGCTKGWLGLLALIAASATASAALALATSEYQLKAVFLFNFAQFVEWPAEAFESPESPLRICVLGSDPFGEELEVVMQGESIHGRSLEVRRHSTPEEAEGCHVLFVNPPSDEELYRTLELLRGEPILTVGERHDFTNAGGVIRFFMEGNRVRLEINPDAAEEAHLRVSSKLLRSSQVLAKRER